VCSHPTVEIVACTVPYTQKIRSKEEEFTYYSFVHHHHPIYITIIYALWLVPVG
jgi:hypothetical protein